MRTKKKRPSRLIHSGFNASFSRLIFAQLMTGGVCYGLLKNKDSSPFISVCGVANLNDVKLMIDQVIKNFGQIDILINDAGIMIVGPLESFEIKEYEKARDIMY